MINKYDKEKIERFINRKSDKSEAQFIYSLFSDNENNREFEHEIRNDFYEYVKSKPDKNYNLS
ncbi:MAG: hypothetical protein Q8L68_00695, partial [Methylococcales bacterium]|nr:hypothetical protein [Methylococcales bacterium]